MALVDCLRPRSARRIARARFGRTALVGALLCATLVKCAVGEALVLHQHGVARAHLHLLGYGDLRSNAASSWVFGHRTAPDALCARPAQQARILAIITTGVVFLPTSSSSGGDETGLFPSGYCLPASSGYRSATDAAACNTEWPVVVGTAAAVILLRNHALLI